jgi:hypothetical protein
MFCTGAAPTVPGISARFSSPGQPWSSVQATKSCQVSPAPASTIQASSLGHQAAARHLDLQHHGLRVARQHQVAAAAQHQLGRAAEFGVAQQAAHVGIAAHAHQRVRHRRQAEAVVGAQVHVVVDHGRGSGSS